jgi:hypothetical protein
METLIHLTYNLMDGMLGYMIAYPIASMAFVGIVNLLPRVVVHLITRVLILRLERSRIS